nr:MAG TPA: hypothetical protein [Caudoviricetes sp.]
MPTAYLSKVSQGEEHSLRITIPRRQITTACPLLRRQRSLRCFVC